MKKLIVAVIFCLVGMSVFAQGNQQGQQRGGERKGPPQEAIDACANKSSGDECTFTGRNESLTGTCFSPDTSKPLACKPSGR